MGGAEPPPPPPYPNRRKNPCVLGNRSEVWISPLGGETRSTKRLLLSAARARRPSIRPASYKTGTDLPNADQPCNKKWSPDEVWNSEETEGSHALLAGSRWPEPSVSRVLLSILSVPNWPSQAHPHEAIARLIRAKITKMEPRGTWKGRNGGTEASDCPSAGSRWQSPLCSYVSSVPLSLRVPNWPSQITLRGHRQTYPRKITKSFRSEVQMRPRVRPLGNALSCTMSVSATAHGLGEWGSLDLICSIRSSEGKCRSFLARVWNIWT